KGPPKRARGVASHPAPRRSPGCCSYHRAAEHSVEACCPQFGIAIPACALAIVARRIERKIKRHPHSGSNRVSRRRPASSSALRTADIQNAAGQRRLESYRSFLAIHPELGTLLDLLPTRLPRD